MKKVLYLFLIITGVLLTGCTHSSNTSSQKKEPDSDSQPEAGQKVVIAYLPLGDWEFETKFPFIQWEYLTHINVSFAFVKADGTLNLSQIQDRIQEVRDTAHKHHVKILVSLAKNSPEEFATAVSVPKARKTLINQIVEFTRAYKLDGFDIDYEEYNSWNNSFPSLLVFARELHQAKDEDMLMTCAVVSRWLDYGTEWGQYFDYINLMSYDRGSFTETPVQHASYEDFVKDLAYWNETCRVPKSKIVGGLPFYGYSWDEDLQETVDEVRGIRYHTVLEYFGTEASEKDVIGKTYYNGRPTMHDKCEFIKEHDYAGVMVWQLFQDAFDSYGNLGLINVIGESMR